MPILKKWQLDEFKRNTWSLQSNKSMDITNYLLLTTDGRLIKTNTRMTCEMHVDFVKKQLEITAEDDLPFSNEGEFEIDFDENVLINEKMLYGIINSSSDELVMITKDDKNIKLSSGKNIITHQLENPELFPATPLYEGSVDFIMDIEIISAIKTAKSFTTKDKSSTFNAVHINKNWIASYNNHSFFVKEFNKEFPNIVLIDDFVELISQFESINFYQTNNHYFFQIPAKDILFVFTKSEFITPDFSFQISIIKKSIESSNHSFSISKDDIIEFCELVDKISNKSVTPATLSEKNRLMYNDESTNSSIIRDIFVDGYAGNFYFNTKLILPGLKSITNLKLDCITVENKFIIKVDENCLAVFMGGQKPVQQEEREQKEEKKEKKSKSKTKESV